MAIYWPIMLKALGFADDEMPTLLVHGWWNIENVKMSKTLGNIIELGVLADWVCGLVEGELIKQKEKEAKKGKLPLSDAELAEISHSMRLRRDGALLSHE